MCHKGGFSVHITPSALVLLAVFLLFFSPLLLGALLFYRPAAELAKENAAVR